MTKFRRLRVFILMILALMFLVPSTGLCIEWADGKVSLNGVFHQWTGYRLGTYGNERGEGLSMFRNSLQLETEIQISEKTFFHAIWRGDIEPEYDIEEDGINFGNFEDDHLTESDLREYYIGSQLTDRLWVALGRQQLVWGDVAGFRVMDVVNPLDLRWHFNQESWEDIRIPLNMVNAIISVPEYNGNLQLVWVPGIDPDYLRVNRSYGTPDHRWGVNNPPGALAPGDVVALGALDEKAEPDGIDNTLSDSDIGFRWQQTIGGFTYAIMDMYKFNDAPAVWADASGFHVKHLRQNILGASFNWFDNYTEGVWHGEIGYFHDLPFTSNTYSLERKDTIKFALGYDRNTYLPFLNPTRSLLHTITFIGTYILDHDDNLITPGFSDWEIKEFDLFIVLLFNYGWSSERWNFYLVPMGNIDRKWGEIQTWLDFKPRWLNGLTMTAKVNYFFSESPYVGDFGLIRGNSEALFEIKYEF